MTTENGNSQPRDGPGAVSEPSPVPAPAAEAPARAGAPASPAAAIAARLSRVARRALAGVRSIPVRLRPLAEERGAGWNVSALMHVFIFGVLVTMVAGRGCLARAMEGTSFAGWLGLLLAFVSNAIFLNLVLVLLLALAATAAVRRWWVPLGVAPALFGLLAYFVYADSIVFLIYRRHIDGVILGIMFDPGAGDVFTVGTWTYIHATALFVATVGAVFAFSLVGVPWLHRRGWMLPLGRGRWLGLVIGLAVTIVLLDKGVYAWADLRDRREYMQGLRLFPLYQPLTVKSFAKHRLGIEAASRMSLASGGGGGTLDYPRGPLTFREGSPRPNVVIIVVEGARFDAFDPRVMPFVHGFGQENIACERHWAGGNNSHFGIFAITYGLYGSYREAAVSGRQAPAMIDALGKRGYVFRVLSCTDLRYAEFSRSSFLGLTDQTTDSWGDGGDRMQRDRLMTDEFIAFVDRNAREGGAPFLAFLWYDGSHQPYWYPPEHAVFETPVSASDLNYVKLAGGGLGAAEPWLMRYRNSLHYVDSQVARAVGALEGRGLLDDTVVVICGDHGEEFNECGYLGHAAAFDRYQAQTVMVAHVPGAGRRRVTRLTSNVDIVPTVLKAAGVENPPSDYSQGVPLTSDTGPEFVFVAGWDVGAVVEDGRISVYGLKAYNAFDSEVSDWDYRPVRGDGPRAGRLGEVLERLGEFMK